MNLLPSHTFTSSKRRNQKTGAEPAADTLRNCPPIVFTIIGWFDSEFIAETIIYSTQCTLLAPLFNPSATV